MEKIELQGNLRTKTGKGTARQLRRDGLIPGIVYGQNENLMVSVGRKDINRLLQKAKANSILYLKVDKEKEKMVMIKELQKDVVTMDFLHVDLLEISMKKKLKISVPIEETGMAMGIKMGGILTHLLRELKVECLPENIPEAVKIDVSNLDIGQTLYVRDIKVPDDVTILSNSDEVVCVVSLPEAEKSKEAEEEAEEEAEAPEATVGDVTAEPAAGVKEKSEGNKEKNREKDKTK